MAHDFPTSGYFYKIFGTYLQKGSVYFYTKEFLTQLLLLLLLFFFFFFFLSYNQGLLGAFRCIYFRCFLREKIIFAFLEEGLFHICRKKKYHLYQHTENIIFPCIFFEKYHLSFSIHKEISHFREKEMPSFLMI